MAVYTYDGDADVLYVLLVDEPEAAIQRTEEIGPNLHVDIDGDGKVVGVEVLHPRRLGVEVREVKRRYGVELEIPFRFAA